MKPILIIDNTRGIEAPDLYANLAANDDTPAHDITLSLYRVGVRVWSLGWWIVVGLVLGLML